MRLPAPEKVIVPFVASKVSLASTVPVKIVMVPSISLVPVTVNASLSTTIVPSTSISFIVLSPLSVRVCPALTMILSVYAGSLFCPQFEAIPQLPVATNVKSISPNSQKESD